MTKQPAKKAKKAPKAPKPIGRPSLYGEKVAAIICARLVEGESLRSICRDSKMPSLQTVFVWLGKHPVFRDQYARAREEQAETLAAEIVDIADEVNYEDIVVEGVTLGVKFDSTAVARNKLRVDARKWVASKLKPKVYGDKVQTEISGELKVASSKHLTDEQLAAIAAGNG